MYELIINEKEQKQLRAEALNSFLCLLMSDMNRQDFTWILYQNVKK